jgi:hypothetical protein
VKHPWTALFVVTAFWSILLLAASGCSSDRVTAPLLPAEPGFLPDSPAGAVSTGSDVDLASPGSGDAGGAQTPHTLSKPVDGTVGGAFKVGRFTVVVPPGAFKGVQTLTLTDTSDQFIECILGPDGMQFDEPVTLSINLMGTAGESESTRIFRYNAAAGTWDDVGGFYYPELHTVLAYVHHTAVYRPGGPAPARSGRIASGNQAP